MCKSHVKCILLVLICLLFEIAFSLYEDQVGKFDWKLSYIGRAKFAHIDAKRVIVATEENVVAALHLKTGQILWRQIMENPENDRIVHLHVDKEVVTISGSKNSWVVRGWDINTGTLLFEYQLFVEHESYWFAKDDVLYQITPFVGSHLEVTSFVLRNGGISREKTRVATPWVVDLSRCILAQHYFACISTDDSNAILYYVDATSEDFKVNSHALSTLIGNVEGRVRILEFEHPEPALLLVRNNIARVVIFGDSPYVQSQAISPNSIAAFNGDSTLILQLEINPDNPEKLLRIVTLKADNVKRTEVEIQYPLGLGAPYTIAANCKGPTCDLLLSSSDNALTLVRIPEAKVFWTREEALSHIVAAELLELPVSELDASIEREFKASGDALSMFYLRLLSQARQLSTLLFGGQLMERSGLVRDEFGLHKLIVVATSVGKLFGIDTFTGSIVWSYRLPHVVPFSLMDEEKMLLFVQRTARYSPLLAQCMLVAKDGHTGNGVLFRFDPISGHSESGIERLNYKIKQAIIFPYEDKDHTKPVIVLSEDDHVYVYPQSSTSIVYEHAKTTYLFTADHSNGQIQGYNLALSTPQEPKLSLNWNLNLAPSKLVALSVRPPHERVHSQGRVLPDRSVYYKYINPNVIAVATLTEDPIHKHVLSVHLVDGVTGLVLFSANHKKVKGPIHLIHSENWAAYTYFNERFRRTEIATVELYEGRVQSNSTVFSSYAVSQLPHAETQAYILPASPTIMTTTLTERGITSKFLLLALSNGIIAEVPWAFVQPRLPDVACLPEEGCIPYMPEIPLPPEASVNYNQSLWRVRGIDVAPARLESTSHVLVHGLDVFYTRVAPSKTFDVLKEDFDHRLIVLVLGGLVVASYVTKKLASRKALRQAWK